MSKRFGGAERDVPLRCPFARALVGSADSDCLILLNQGNRLTRNDVAALLSRLSCNSGAAVAMAEPWAACGMWFSSRYEMRVSHWRPAGKLPKRLGRDSVLNSPAIDIKSPREAARAAHMPWTALPPRGSPFPPTQLTVD